MIKSLTSFRFFFALMVFFHHLEFLSFTHVQWLKTLYLNVFKEGYIGVSFFFILSGFIMQYSYGEKILNKKISYSKFMTLRFFRIYPMHYITLLIFIPLIIVKVNDSNIYEWIKMLFFNSTLTQSFHPQFYYYFSFNTPSWSLSNEMFFYACFPFLVMLNKHKHFITILSLLLTALIFILIYNSQNPYNHWFFYVFPITRLADFILGIMLYEFYLKLKKTPLQSFNFTIFEIASIAVFVLFFIFHDTVKQEYRYSIYYWIPTLLLILVFAIEKGVLSQILSKKIFEFLGEISFSFYLWHVLVLRYFEYCNVSISNVFVYIFLLLTVTIILSSLSFLFIETPINNYIKRKINSYQN